MELNNYIITWLHQYIIHFGILTGFFIGATTCKQGIPLTLSGIFKLVAMAALLGALTAIFSSHSHVHYLQTLAK